MGMTFCSAESGGAPIKWWSFATASGRPVPLAGSDQRDARPRQRDEVQPATLNPLERRVFRSRNPVLRRRL
jgi:hypothetical protein